MFALGDDLPIVIWSAAAGKTDYMGFSYNGPHGKYDVLCLMRGYTS